MPWVTWSPLLNPRHSQKCLTVHRSPSTNQRQSPSNLRNYITLKSEIFILSNCSRKASDNLFAMRSAVCMHAELPLTSAINMQKKIHWLPNISQAARVFVSHTISSLYQTTLTSKQTTEGSAYLKKKTFECLLDADLIFAMWLYSLFPGYLSSAKCFQHRLPKPETVRNVQNKRICKGEKQLFL